MELGGMCPRRVPRYLISLPVPLGHSHSKGFPMFGLGTLLLCSILFCFYIGTRAIGIHFREKRWKKHYPKTYYPIKLYYPLYYIPPEFSNADINLFNNLTIDSYLILIDYYLFAALGLSCNTQDLWSSLQHVGPLVLAWELLVVACAI